ncbi:hypothetical protein [Dankookia sp. P2]|uniref:hypothetical protein n=1 Tax=Dankookia sp. P2 TaxID=3423955 RepID=UPI003D664458
MKPTDYPSNGRDWEARQFGDFATSPNRRARPADYPVNDANSPIKVLNFNAVGGSTIIYTGHFPRLHPRTSGSARWTAWPMTGPSTTTRWSPTSPRTTGWSASPAWRATRASRRASRRCRRCRSAGPAPPSPGR